MLQKNEENWVGVDNVKQGMKLENESVKEKFIKMSDI